MPRVDRRGTHVYLLAGTFSVDSGGRTKATFLKARELARVYGSCTVLTFNFRLAYDEIVPSWLDSIGAPDNVHVANLYDHLADEPFYAATGPRRLFAPDADLRRRKSGAWERRGPDGKLTERYVLAADGTLNYSDAWRDGIRTQHVNYDRHGAARVVTELRPGTREPLARRRYTASGRLFMSERIDDGGAVTACVIGGPGDTGGELVPILDLQYRWIAALAVGQPAVFLCEARALDGHAAVLNPYLPPGGLRTVASIHSNHLRPPYDDPQSVWTFNDWALSHAADFSAVVVLTRMQREEIALHYGEAGTMVDIGHPVVPARLRRSLRARVGSLVRRPPRVVLVTRLAQVKRLDDVLQAFRLVVDQVPTAKLEIWGTGDQQESLEKLAAELGLKRRVRFAGYTHDAAGAFRRGQVSISTSIGEGLGMSTLESLAAGTPVVAYDYRYGPRDLITHGRDGYVVPNGDVEALAAAVARILARPARARLMGAWALRVRLTRSVRRYRKQWVALIDSTEHGAARRRLPSRGGEANRTPTPPEQGAASR